MESVIKVMSQLRRLRSRIYHSGSPHNRMSCSCIQHNRSQRSRTDYSRIQHNCSHSNLRDSGSRIRLRRSL